MAKSKKVNKWEAAPESIKLLHNAFTAFNTMSYTELDDKVDWDELDELLVNVLRAYNELEAKHNADCGLISKLEEDVKTYKTLADELHDDVDELESKLDRAIRERNTIEYTLNQLIEQLKIKNDVYVNLEGCTNGVYEIEDKHAADLQEDLDAAILDLKKEEEHSQALSKVITRKNAEMCNLKWERDETEKKLKILTEELISQYNINVTFYQRPGIDMHGLKNFGVHVDCEENRKAFNDLNEELNKYKAKNEKLEEKHAKATRFITRLTEALNEAGVEFHYVKIGDDGEAVFHIDSLIDKLAKKHYEEQYDRLRGTIRNYEAQIYEFKNDRREIDHRNRLLLKALDQAGIHPNFDIRANEWRIQYTDAAENAFLAADQIKRDAEKKIDKLVSALDRCRLDAKWDHENDKWRIYVRPSDTELTRVSVNMCEVVEGYEKLKNENKALILEKGNLKSKNRSWQVSYNAVQKKVGELTAERDGLNDYAEALKGRIQELEDRSKDIYNLATIGWLNNSMYGYEEIRKMLSFKPSTCTNCKNYDPKE